MLDVARIGGVTGWIQAGGIAATAGIEMSSHLMPEISAQLLCATASAHWLEYVDWADAFSRNQCASLTVWPSPPAVLAPDWIGTKHACNAWRHYLPCCRGGRCGSRRGDRVSALLGLRHTVQATTATVVSCKRTSKS